jgi:hypothetical protein
MGKLLVNDRCRFWNLEVPVSERDLANPHEICSLLARDTSCRRRRILRPRHRAEEKAKDEVNVGKGFRGSLDLCQRICDPLETIRGSDRKLLVLCLRHSWRRSHLPAIITLRSHAPSHDHASVWYPNDESFRTSPCARLMPIWLGKPHGRPASRTYPSHEVGVSVTIEAPSGSAAFDSSADNVFTFRATCRNRSI